VEGAINLSNRIRQVSELHLDERINAGREAIGKQLASGQKKVSTAFNNLWADIEVMREAQRKRAAEQKTAAEASSGNNHSADKNASGMRRK